ncbi:hypothetical protein U9M48_027298 [Paspalum notatum var. saurae]|uniref:Uncharacterized protein n=1 Tax=Paspalum notatum var. saurae TaxID=547442 RepID=A0AAQ3TUH4_PASNO
MSYLVALDPASPATSTPTRDRREPENQEDDPEDPEYLPKENADEQDLGDDEPDNLITRDDWYED